jgi:hypothetical protein
MEDLIFKYERMTGKGKNALTVVRGVLIFPALLSRVAEGLAR